MISSSWSTNNYWNDEVSKHLSIQSDILSILTSISISNSHSLTALESSKRMGILLDFPSFWTTLSGPLSMIKEISIFMFMLFGVIGMVQKVYPCRLNLLDHPEAGIARILYPYSYRLYSMLHHNSRWRVIQKFHKRPQHMSHVGDN